MKKLFALLTVFILVFSLFTFTAFAEESTEPEEDTVTEGETVPEDPIENAPTEGEMSENEVKEDKPTDEIPQDTQQDASKVPTIDENEILDQILGIVTNGEIWAKIGVSLLAAVALVITLKKQLDKILAVFATVRDALMGKATKEDTAKVVKEEFNAFNTSYKEEYAKLEEKNVELTEKYNAISAKCDKLTALLALITLQLVKSPNARTQIMGLISDAKEIGGDVVKLVENIETEIKDADAAIPKIDTPNLDAIVGDPENEDITEEEEETKEDTMPYMRLE